MHVTHLSPHVSNDSKSLYHLVLTPTVTVAVSGVPRDGSRMHTHDHDGSEAPDESLDSIISSEPKPPGSIGLDPLRVHIDSL
ncbi:hypothetical protein Tco_0311287 [Tanacetum coccineum]